jgi:hypothetical protein
MLRLIILVYSLLLGSNVVYGCSCAPGLPGPCDRTSNRSSPGSLSFVGTVTSAENPGIADTMEGYRTLSRYHFVINELLDGPDKREVDLISTRGGGDCSAHFKVGATYLIYAYQVRDSAEVRRGYYGPPAGSWSTSICSGNRLASDAAVFLSELRARRRGERSASLYGVLRRVQQPYSTVAQGGYEQPISGARLNLTEGDRRFETITDAEGRYFFYDLPGGKYKLAADLPNGLELGHTILTNPLPPLRVPNDACMEHSINALPKTRIRGQVLDSAGRSLTYASVVLYRSELYGKVGPGLQWNESQKQERPFEFVHVAPGDYVLVFNEEDSLDPDQPFPRTFYGNVHHFADAKYLTVSEADDVVTADIHVTGGSPTRELTVRVLRNDGQLEDDAYLTVTGSRGKSPFPKKVAPGVYTINLLNDATYTISAKDTCFRLNSRVIVASDPVIVAGEDIHKSEVTVLLPRGACPK